MNILVVNAGSSSHKFTLYDLTSEVSVAQAADVPLWEADLQWSKSHGTVNVEIRTPAGSPSHLTLPSNQRARVFQAVISSLTAGVQPVLKSFKDIVAVGHRVVHGGAQLTQPVVLDSSIIEQIEACIPLAPAHQPAALEMIRMMNAALPEAIPVAVFDTAFHAGMPRAARVYPGPYEWVERGWQRFGFHGLSYQYLSLRVPQLQSSDAHRSRMVACHLGNGASVAALRDGCSVDTSMGFTPLEGLMMGSRSGSIDPGLLLHMLRSGESVDSLTTLLQEHSGLVGLSGVSNDIREVLSAQATGNDRACLALEVYVHRLSAGIAAMTAALSGIDSLVFTGGVGEHTPQIREQVCRQLGYLGLVLDPEKNELQPNDDRNIAADTSAVAIFVIKAQEDLMIAYSVRELMEKGEITSRDFEQVSSNRP